LQTEKNKAVRRRKLDEIKFLKFSPNEINELLKPERASVSMELERQLR